MNDTGLLNKNEKLVNMDNFLHNFALKSFIFMELYGVRENIHLLISSYLDGRKQFVSFGGYR